MQIFSEAGDVLLKSLMGDLSVEKGSLRFLVYLKAIRASKRANCDREQKAVWWAGDVNGNIPLMYSILYPN